MTDKYVNLLRDLFCGSLCSVGASMAGGGGLYGLKHATGWFNVMLSIYVFVGSIYLFHIGTVYFSRHND